MGLGPTEGRWCLGRRKGVTHLRSGAFGRAEVTRVRKQEGFYEATFDSARDFRNSARVRDLPTDGLVFGARGGQRSAELRPQWATLRRAGRGLQLRKRLHR